MWQRLIKDIRYHQYYRWFFVAITSILFSGGKAPVRSWRYSRIFLHVQPWLYYYIFRCFAFNWLYLSVFKLIWFCINIFFEWLHHFSKLWSASFTAVTAFHFNCTGYQGKTSSDSDWCLFYYSINLTIFLSQQKVLACVLIPMLVIWLCVSNNLLVIVLSTWSFGDSQQCK